MRSCSFPAVLSGCSGKRCSQCICCIMVIHFIFDHAAVQWFDPLHGCREIIQPVITTMEHSTCCPFPSWSKFAAGKIGQKFYRVGIQIGDHHRAFKSTFRNQVRKRLIYSFNQQIFFISRYRNTAVNSRAEPIFVSMPFVFFTNCVLA